MTVEDDRSAYSTPSFFYNAQAFILRLHGKPFTLNLYYLISKLNFELKNTAVNLFYSVVKTRQGNLELCVLSGSGHRHYGDLIENDSRVISQIDMEQIKETYEKPDDRHQPKIIDMDDAYLDGKKLNLGLNQPS